MIVLDENIYDAQLEARINSCIGAVTCDCMGDC
jgi:hypothetical protein